MEARSNQGTRRIWLDTSSLCCSPRNVEAVKKLLEKDKSVAYVAANGDEGNTALHIAATVGYVSVMEELLSYCPDCWEMVNSKGQNILHIAAYYEYERHWATDFILKRPWAAQLINQKDNEGNTPLHLLASTRKDKGLYEYPTADTGVVNNKNWTPADINYGEDICKDWPQQIWHNNGRDTLRKDRERIINWTMHKEEREREKEERENQDQVDKKQNDKEREDKIRVEGMAKTHMIVATLVATISFAASFTIPGGYHQDGPIEGTAILLRDAAFNVFVITNTVAVICSTSSVFLYLSASLFNLEDEEEKVTRRYLIALWLVIIALFATMLAFVTGSYTVLGHSLRLAIPICVIACFSFMVYASKLIKLIDARLVA
ncbi:hypothetical protein Vadar_000961 [Vaccinium darrowii]|uniref:Uncharacterized protein n=1 Tax=Vaccinium darrowii TaxID=229202 RepID=A0ACB7YBJ2_9ERIC|nr:hypothetical protein Vadar_000961 [Vaccinium darrowii]